MTDAEKKHCEMVAQSIDRDFGLVRGRLSDLADLLFRERALARSEGDAAMRKALLICKNLTRYQEWSAQGEVGEIGKRVGECVDEALRGTSK